LFKHHFTADEVGTYAHHPEAIANRLYEDRLGNGDEDSGDGWKYRGRGLIQVTGKKNYLACGTALRQDLIGHPEILELPMFAALSAGWFWHSHNLNELADEGHFEGITEIINGGLTGESKREEYWKQAQTIWY
jgi:putative chitinase